MYEFPKNDAFYHCKIYILKYQNSKNLALFWSPFIPKLKGSILVLGDKKSTLHFWLISSFQRNFLGSFEVCDEKNLWITSIHWKSFKDSQEIIVGCSNGSVFLVNASPVLEHSMPVSVEKLANKTGIAAEIISCYSNMDKYFLFIGYPGYIVTYAIRSGIIDREQERIIDLPSKSLVTSILAFFDGKIKIFVSTQDSRYLCYGFDGVSWVADSSAVTAIKKSLSFTAEESFKHQFLGDSDDLNLTGMLSNTKNQYIRISGSAISSNGLSIALSYNYVYPENMYYEFDFNKSTKFAIIQNSSLEQIPFNSLEYKIENLSHTLWDLCSRQRLQEYSQVPETPLDIGFVWYFVRQISENSTDLNLIQSLKLLRYLVGGTLSATRDVALRKIDTFIRKIHLLDFLKTHSVEAIKENGSQILIIVSALFKFIYLNEAEFEVCQKKLDIISQNTLTSKESALLSELRSHKNEILMVESDTQSEFFKNVLLPSETGRANIDTSSKLFTSIEECPICQSSIVFDDIRKAKCTKNLENTGKCHTWSRDTRKLYIIEDPYKVYHCEICESTYRVDDDQLEGLKYGEDKCLFCSGQLISSI